MEVKITVNDKEYIIGKEYEFSDMLQEDKSFEVKWHTGKLTGYCPHPNSANSFVCGSQYYIYCREKLKQSLFTTEDGVDIFGNEQNSIFYIKKGEHKAIPINPTNYWLQENCVKGVVVTKPKNLWFFSKEAAEEYVLMHKPMLSLEDILLAWNEDQNIEAYKDSLLFQRFREFAKTKLQTNQPHGFNSIYRKER